LRFLYKKSYTEPQNVKMQTGLSYVKYLIIMTLAYGYCSISISGASYYILCTKCSGYLILIFWTNLFKIRIMGMVL